MIKLLLLNFIYSYSKQINIIINKIVLRLYSSLFKISNTCANSFIYVNENICLVSFIIYILFIFLVLGIIKLKLKTFTKTINS